MSEASLPAHTPDRMIRMKAVLERTGFSRSTLYRKLAAGTFPKQIQLSERCVGWRESAVNAWLRDAENCGVGK